MAKIFMSYSHQDEGLRDELEKQLAMLKREGAIEIWHDRCIRAGDPLDRAIAAEIQDADVVLLLVSPDFLHSSYCYDVEVAAAMKRHEAGEARVIPVILRPCDWQSQKVPFRSLLAIPKDGRPVTKWADRDEAMLDIVQRLRASLPQSAVVLPQKTSISGDAPVAVSRPRSSNLRIAKKYTRADLDEFLDDTFEYVAKYFENSLDELQSRYDEIRTRYRRIDANAFGCIVYRNGSVVARCGIRRRGESGFGNGITYSNDDSAPANTMNEQLTAGADDQAMWLQPLGMQFHGRGETKGKLTQEGAADYFWELLIEPLQRS